MRGAPNFTPPSYHEDKDDLLRTIPPDVVVSQSLGRFVPAHPNLACPTILLPLAAPPGGSRNAVSAMGFPRYAKAIRQSMRANVDRETQRRQGSK